MPTFSAALLAGGQSTRMGRDKALLALPGSKELLWQRQMGVLEKLKMHEIFWSGAPRPGLPAHVRVVPDEVANAGPLAGISACLRAPSSDLVLVLAIDLPRMSADYLRGLLARCSNGRGVVAKIGEHFEPLAAVYPKGILPLATERLAQGRYVLQEFVREGARRKLLDVIPVNPDDVLLFKNVNAPADLKDL